MDTIATGTDRKLRPISPVPTTFFCYLSIIPQSRAILLQRLWPPNVITLLTRPKEITQTSRTATRYLVVTPNLWITRCRWISRWTTKTPFKLNTELSFSSPTIKAMHCRSRTNSVQPHKKKLNSMVWVRERTIPIERPPLVGEVTANSCGKREPRGQRDGSLRPYSRFSRDEPLLFYQVAPQLYSRGWVDSVPDPLFFSLSAGNRIRASGSVARNSDH
jgi:hypothetical protein